MSNPSLIAKLGIDESDFKRGLEASESRLLETQEKAKLLAAQVALLQVEMSKENDGRGTQAQIEQYRGLETALRGARAEAVAMGKQLTALEAIKPPAAPVAAAPVAAVPDESARYEAHWRKLEEQERSQRANAAISQTLAPAPSAAPVKVELTRDQKSLVGEDTEVVLGRLFSSNHEKGRQPGRTNAPEGRDDQPHGGGSNRMRDAELAHSARSFVDMLGAGANPLQALQMEAPRLIQAFGGGLATILGVGGAVAGLATVIGKTVELTQEAKELRKGFAEAMSEPTRGVQSVESLSAHVKALDASLEKESPTSGWFSRIKQKLSDTLTTAGENISEGNFNRGGAGWHNAHHERNDRVSAEEEARGAALEKIVAAEKTVNDLKEEGFRLGKDLVKASELELERQNKIAEVQEGFGIPKLTADLKQAESPEEKKRLQKELEDKNNAAEGSIGEVNRDFDLRLRMAGLDLQKGDINRAHKVHDAYIDHPEILGANGGDNLLAVDPTNPLNVSMRKKLGERDRAISTEAAIRARGGDSRDAHADVINAESNLRDAAVEEAMKLPAQRQQERSQETQRRQAAERVETLARRHAEIDEANHPDLALRTERRGIIPIVPTVPNRIDDHHAGAQNAGKGDAHAADMKGVEGKLDKIIENTGSMFKNRK